VLGYDEGLSRVRVDEWQNCGDYAQLRIIAIMLSSRLCEVTAKKSDILWPLDLFVSHNFSYRSLKKS
jgi:hypothetical protein